MSTLTAYFAGAGTVVVAVAIGVGGGLMVANSINPTKPVAEATKLERRMSSEPIPATSASPAANASEPGPYLAATQAAATSPVVVQSSPQASPPPGQPAVEPANIAQPATSTSSQGPAPQVALQQPNAAPEDAFAKASEADEKQAAKRAAVEKRRAERRQRWAERRRNQMRQQEDTLRDVEQKVREDTEGPRLFASEPGAMEPVGMETPRIRLFDGD